MSDDFELVTVEHVLGIKETAYAVLCEHAPSHRRAWIPQSQIGEDSEVFGAGHNGKLVIPLWLAEREGFV